MSRMQQEFIKINDQEIHVRVWNKKEQELATLFCAHGFTSTSADFLVLGESLANKGYRVIAPDMLGRGLSQWSKNPAKDYNLTNYAQIALNIIRHFNCSKLHWVGNDMGALIGIFLASNDKYKSIFTSMVLNDIGPEVPEKAVKEIINQAREKHHYAQFLDGISVFEKRYFPPCEDKDILQKVCEASLRRLSNGNYTLHFDKNIFLPNTNTKITLWNRFEKLTLPIMVLHGINSQVLSKKILSKMRKIQEKLVINYCIGCDHPPSLFSHSHCSNVINFIKQNQENTSLEKSVKR